MSEPREVAALYRRHLARGFAVLLGGRVETEASGTRIRGADGKSYLDCGSYAVFLLGHRHPRVVAAVMEQLQVQPLASGLLLSPPRARAAEALARVAPEGLEHVIFANSGAEATEVAIKLARLNGKRHLVTMSGAFHGMTTGALALAGNPLYGELFDPLLPNVVRVPFADPDALDDALAEIEGEGCVFIEPIQGEAGVIVPPDDYLPSAAEICRQRGSLLVFDEIQCGLGRAGSWWESDRVGVVPDILLAGKVLSGGVIPTGALVTSRTVFDVLTRDPFLHGSTFAGSPLQAAAVTAALGVLEDESLVSRSQRLGEVIRERLRTDVMDRFPGLIEEVRGRGLLIGLRWSTPELAGQYVLEMLERGLIPLPCTSDRRVVRLTPPAVMTDSEVDELLAVNRDAGRALAERHAAGQRT